MIESRQAAQAFFTKVIALSPMATGGNLPYRRLCCHYGVDLTCSEMVVADKLFRRVRSEHPLLRSHPAEKNFGIQLCGKSPTVLAEAAQLAVSHGCRFLDLNFGCPIDLIVRRGAGAALLERPARLAALVAAVREVIDVPLSVKIRLGWSQKRVNAVQVARLCEQAGADAVGVHGRTRDQHYKRNADWEAIAGVAAAITIPVLGNGDILTPWDLALRRATSGVTSFLVARGALIKPWIFRELKTNQVHNPRLEERWGMMRRYYDYALEYFGSDALGLARVKRFFLWHLEFWHRYRPYTETDFQAARPASLIQLRDEPLLGGEPDEILLAKPDETAHEVIWQRVHARDYPGA